MAGLSSWYALHNNIGSLRMTTAGDSITAGGAIDSVRGWVGALRTLANTRWGNGGDGLQNIGFGIGQFAAFSRNWTFQPTESDWTHSGSGDAWAVAPLNQGIAFANGATKTMTWTNASSVTCDYFEVYCVDGASAGDFSYSLNGGSSWTNCGFTGFTASNTIKTVTIKAPVTSTLMLRAANAAGTAVNVYIQGAAMRTRSPGLVIDNVATGGQYLFTSVDRSQWDEWFNLMAPQLVTVMFTNDADFTASVTPYRANLDEFVDEMVTHGAGVLLMNFFEQTGREANEVLMRADLKACALAKGMPYIDFYDYDRAHGGNGTGIANGWTDGGHETDAGALIMAQEVWKVISKIPNGWQTKAA